MMMNDYAPKEEIGLQRSEIPGKRTSHAVVERFHGVLSYVITSRPIRRRVIVVCHIVMSNKRKISSFFT